MNTGQHLVSETGIKRDVRICTAQNAVIDRMKTDLSAARSTLVTTGRVEDGLACVARQDRFETVMDFGPGMGGDKKGPSPGFYARAAVAGCVAMAVKMHAARLGLVFDAVEVTVEAEFDDAALFGLTASSAAPLETRVNIHVDTAEPEAIVRAFIDNVLEMDPWYLALRDPQKVVRSVSVEHP